MVLAIAVHPLVSVTVAEIALTQRFVTEAEPAGGTVKVAPVLKETVYEPALPPDGLITSEPVQFPLQAIFVATDPVETGGGAVTVFVIGPLAHPFLSVMLNV